MEEGDDDFYGSGPARDGATNGRPPQLKDEQMDDASEGEDDEDEDDEDVQDPSSSVIVRSNLCIRMSNSRWKDQKLLKRNKGE